MPSNEQKEERCKKIAEQFGYLSHPAQDFYSHSDWVEIHKAKGLPLRPWNRSDCPPTVDGEPVVSGLWGGGGPSTYRGKKVPKHGLIFGGLHKDLSPRTNFDDARNLAKEATQQELNTTIQTPNGPKSIKDILRECSKTSKKQTTSRPAGPTWPAGPTKPVH